MKKTIALLIVILLHYSRALAQAPGIEWSKCLNGSIGETSKCITETPGGGYVVCGSARATMPGYHGEGDGWVAKLGQYGELQWEKCYGGSRADLISAIKAVASGGYIMVGQTESNDGDVSGGHGMTDVWLVKLDDTGYIEWQKCLGGSKYDIGCDIKECRDGGYIIAGYSESDGGDVSGLHTAANNYGDAWIVKTDAMGTIEWQKCAGGNDRDIAVSIVETPDSGYVAGGSSWSQNLPRYHTGGLGDCYVFKLDKNGQLEWQKCYGGSDTEGPATVANAVGGGYILAGSTRSADGDVNGLHALEDYLAIKIGDTGAIEWQKCYGGSNNDEAVYDMQATTGGGYVLAGSAQSYDGDVIGKHFGGDDYWIVKIRDDGDIDWQKCLGGSSIETAYSIIQTSDMGYAIAGMGRSTDGDMVNNIFGTCTWIVKLSRWPENVMTPASERDIVVSPNPSDGHFTVTIPESEKTAQVTITNMLGEAVLQKEPGDVKAEITIPNVPGVYYVIVKAGEACYTAKLIVD